MPIDVTRDRMIVTHTPVDAKGDKVEAEQQVVIREMTSMMSVDVASRPGAEDAFRAGAIPMTVEAAMPAEQTANAMRSMCYTCKHFDTDRFKKLKALWERGTPEQRRSLRNIEIALMTTGNSKLVEHTPDEDGQIDTDEAMSILGVCKALTVLHNDPVIVHPLSCCPEEVCDAQHLNGFHVPAGLAEERQGNKMFDDVMRKAQGKIE
jgi:hypothetical protein